MLSFINLRYHAEFALTPYPKSSEMPDIDLSLFLSRLHAKITLCGTLQRLRESGVVQIPEYSLIRRHYEGYSALNMVGSWHQKYLDDVRTIVDLGIFRVRQSLKESFTIEPYWVTFKIHCNKGVFDSLTPVEILEK